MINLLVIEPTVRVVINGLYLNTGNAIATLVAKSSSSKPSLRYLNKPLIRLANMLPFWAFPNGKLK